MERESQPFVMAKELDSIGLLLCYTTFKSPESVILIKWFCFKREIRNGSLIFWSNAINLFQDSISFAKVLVLLSKFEPQLIISEANGQERIFLFHFN